MCCNCGANKGLLQGPSSFTARNSVELFFLLFLSVLDFWGMLWECTLRSYRVLHFYQHKTYNYNTCSLYKLMPLLYNLSHYIWVVIVIHCTSCIALSCCEDLFQGFCPGFLSKELQKIMGDLYWSSLANSFMDYYWFNLMKRNCFRCRTTVLWPKCYTLEVKLGTIDIAYKYSTIMGTGIVHPSLTHFKLLCSFYRYQYTSSAIQYSIAKHFTHLTFWTCIDLLMSYGTRSGLNFIQVIFPVFWGSSMFSWCSSFWCPTSYRWFIAC